MWQLKPQKENARHSQCKTKIHKTNTLKWKLQFRFLTIFKTSYFLRESFSDRSIFTNHNKVFPSISINNFTNFINEFYLHNNIVNQEIPNAKFN